MGTSASSTTTLGIDAPAYIYVPFPGATHEGMGGGRSWRG